MREITINYINFVILNIKRLGWLFAFCKYNAQWGKKLMFSTDDKEILI